jgi:hypothetical protein
MSWNQATFPSLKLEKEGWMRGQEKYREATFVRADGVVKPAKSSGLNTFAELTTFMASRYRARASHPSAAIRWLRAFY